MEQAARFARAAMRAAAVRTMQAKLRSRNVPRDTALAISFVYSLFERSACC
jgi:hypothetical protein